MLPGDEAERREAGLDERGFAAGGREAFERPEQFGHYNKSAWASGKI